MKIHRWMFRESRWLFIGIGLALSIVFLDALPILVAAGLFLLFTLIAFLIPEEGLGLMVKMEKSAEK
jgi:hypothetical protein